MTGDVPDPSDSSSPVPIPVAPRTPAPPRMSIRRRVCRFKRSVSGGVPAEPVEASLLLTEHLSTHQKNRLAERCALSWRRLHAGVAMKAHDVHVHDVVVDEQRRAGCHREP
jgi:hypothetical protein